MNGKPLPKIHGGPLRLVVTGYIGARSCKWVYKINALSVPSYGPVQRQEYLYYSQQVRNHLSSKNEISNPYLHAIDRKTQYPCQQRFLYSTNARLVRPFFKEIIFVELD